ncbi:MAG: F0F1 ATP synthase subunit delta [Deltaproteobacteria bacterium]|nr:F0F1 ATP synthase subunit delta [Deltaproteobacteria bacterium]MBW1951717.1 F0F1 ATP synthase subunit delta [Deltaproteobacteria bacterium]MBW1987261.1 F0F1 ATP synthase subunit delta [Deltaproteobacteria bacterium]MBW2134730.1 F0F1 ATP synthase subunit delta [Deltaproteobacteria bacterium]
MINLTIARRYAKALLTIGKEDGRYKDYGEELSAFAHLLEREPDLKNAIINPIYSQDDRKSVLLRIVELINLSPIVSNFVKLLFDKRRIDAVLGISQVYQQLVDQLENVSRTQVKTAFPLDETTLTRIRETLEKITGNTVVMEVEEDPTIIGGVLARAGDLILDGSVRTQLQSLTESLKRSEVF